MVRPCRRKHDKSFGIISVSSDLLNFESVPCRDSLGNGEIELDREASAKEEENRVSA